MPTRRDVVFSVAGVVVFSGCTAPPTAKDQPTTGGSTIDREVPAVMDPPRDPKEAVRQFYRALVTADVAALNKKLVHPASPTYPVRGRHVPPKVFQEFTKIIIDSVKSVSPQAWIVQRLYPNVTEISEMKRRMNVEAYQFVHTRLYLKKPDEKQAYEANTVDYTVRDNDQWYVRYDATDPTVGRKKINSTETFTID